MERGKASGRRLRADEQRTREDEARRAGRRNASGSVRQRRRGRWSVGGGRRTRQVGPAVSERKERRGEE